MALKLHYHSASWHSRRVQAALIELDISCEMKLVDIFKGDNRQPGYLRLNPNAKVPVLEDDGLVLWESNAINCYLAEKRPEKGLYGSSAQERAEVNRWLFWNAQHFGQAAGTLTLERVLKPMMKAESQPQLVAEAEANLQRYGAVLNSHLESHPWVANDRLTIADLAIVSGLMYREPAQMNLKTFRHLNDYLAKVESRDSWTKTAPQR
jgi:glutathione S-transferase